MAKNNKKIEVYISEELKAKLDAKKDEIFQKSNLKLGRATVVRKILEESVENFSIEENDNIIPKGMRKLVLKVDKKVFENADLEAEKISEELNIKISRTALIRKVLHDRFLPEKTPERRRTPGKIIWKIPKNKVMTQDGVFWESNEKIQQYRKNIEEAKAGTKERTEALSEYEKILNDHIKSVKELLLFRED